MEYTNKGTSIISRKAAEERRRHFFKQKSYWEQLEKRKGNHQYVRSALLDMNELSGEFLIMPRLLEQFFFLYLNKQSIGVECGSCVCLTCSSILQIGGNF